MNRLPRPPLFFVSTGVIALALALFFGAELMVRLGLRRFGMHLGADFIAKEAHDVQRPILAFLIFAYGVWRAIGFHPAFYKRYRNWLATTPWTAVMPLPFGPVVLAWQDALLLALATPLAIYAGLPVLDLAAALCGGYAAAAAIALAFTQRFRPAYVIAIGFAAMLRAHHEKVLYVVISFVLAAIASAALRRSLRYFPWQIMVEIPLKKRPAAPFDRLGPLKASSRLSTVQAVAISLLIASWGYVFVWKDEVAFEPAEVQMLMNGIGVILALGRLLAYVGDGYVPPISFLGRLFTGRIIVPGFDKILLAPACVVLIFWELPPTLLRLGWTEPAMVGVTMGLGMTALLGLGPSLNQWRLTGSHRILLNIKTTEPTHGRTAD